MTFPTKYDPNHPDEAEVSLPNAPREPLSESWAELQPPLSRRGHGPGAILYLPPPSQSTSKATTLDPEPVMKWAEEGYAVVAIQHNVGRQQVEAALSLGLEALKSHKDVDVKDKFAVFGALHAGLYLLVNPAETSLP
jgi:carboxymethylenebutenolidase